VEHPNLAQWNLLADEVYVNLNMLHATMIHWIGRHINTHIITMHNGRQRNGDVKFL
jgi:hypothetical protein